MPTRDRINEVFDLSGLIITRLMQLGLEILGAYYVIHSVFQAHVLAR